MPIILWHFFMNEGETRFGWNATKGCDADDCESESYKTV